MRIVQGRWTRGCSNERDQLEEIQARIVGAISYLEELELRIVQAMRRSDAVVDVLAPAHERTAILRRDLERAQAGLAAYYGAQVPRWQSERNSSS